METQTHNSPVQHKAHYGSRPYAVANAEAAQKASTRLKARFAQGSARLQEALDSVENDIPQDSLVPHNLVVFDYSGGDLSVGFRPALKKAAPAYYRMHPHAFNQFLARAAIPKKYAETLVAEDKALLVTNLRERYWQSRVGKQYLARVVNGEVRGWLSDSYGRYDVKPMVSSFLQTCMKYGAVPVSANNLATRFYLKMMVPIIYEPVENEILAFGVQFRSSDYGDGSYEIRGFLSRVWCTNDAMTEDCLRKIHLGPKLTAANFSQETLEKQTEMLALATRDTVDGILKPENIERRLAVIKAADEMQIPIDQTLRRMQDNRELTKAEVERAHEILTTSDVEVLPPVRVKPKKGHTSLYRFANVFSAMAGELAEEDAARAMDLEVLSGKTMGLQTKE